MSINHTILGMLSCKPLTGYDLKKVMQTTEFMPWSGNNNQIYKALLELADRCLVSGTVHHQDSSPSKKVYSITSLGLAELKEWTRSKPESFDIKKPFLLQLAWADLLSDEELQLLLDQYRQEINGRMLMAQKQAERSFFSQGRTTRESALWMLVHENIIASYRSELDWIDKAKETLL